MLMKTNLLISIFLWLSLAMGNLVAQNATITGVVTEDETNGFLIGTSITIKGTTTGVVSNSNGQYTMFVPAGKQTIEFSFIGFKTQSHELEFKPGEVITLNVLMQSESQVLEGIVVSAQAKGQMAAVSRQINASGVINAVSEEKLRELPDVNVADAIGRLPGLMIQRDGGEGQKIIIRGLDPKFNAVAINGMNAPSSSATDRSTDLNMISPDMVAGAEVLKANTADKDADGLGGTVNLIMKDAPSGLRMNVMAEGGYHSQIRNLGRMKLGIMASNRYFSDKFGVILSASADETDRSNDTFRANYDVSGNVPTEGLDYTRPWITASNVESNVETRMRYNANLNFDWTLGAGSKIKMSNLYSRMERDRMVRQKRYDVSGNRMRFTQRDIESDMTNFTNILQGDFNLWGTTLNLGAGRSQVNNNTPYSHDMEYYLDAPFKVSTSTLSYLAPYLVMDKRLVDESDITKWYLYRASFDLEKAKEVEYSAWLDWMKPFGTGKIVNGYIKVGGKYRGKERSLETDRRYGRMDLSADLGGIATVLPDIAKSSNKNGDQIGLMDLLDPNYKSHEFLNGKYPNLRHDFALSRSGMRDYYNALKDVVEPSGSNNHLYQRTVASMIHKDYSGREEMWAAYLMTEINFGKYVTFIPGVRYDYSFLKYEALSGENVPEEESESEELPPIERTSDIEKFDYFLPQIHLRIKPFEWFDIRLAYTQTLSRPDYNLLAPRTLIAPTTRSVTWQRTNLKPVFSTNYDAVLTFYQPDYGMFSVSGFYKKIDNFIYTRSAYLLEGTATDPGNFGLSTAYSGYAVNYPLNSPYTADLKGIEFDLQVQFRKLENFMKGIVVSANTTFMDSKMNYFETLRGRVRNPDFVAGQNSPFLPVNTDVVYTDRLLNQPSTLLNISLGYDYRRFSGRVSCNYQDGVLVAEQHRPDGADKESTRAFTKFDAQFKYNINSQFTVYATMANFTNSTDRQRRDITNFPSRVEYYGSAFYIGLKYDIFK